MTDIMKLTDERVRVERFGTRAARLSQMARAGLPVPEGVVLPFDVVAALADGAMPDLPADILSGPVALRSSPGDEAWGGSPAILNIGVNDAFVADADNARWAVGMYRRLIQNYAMGVDGLDPELFENIYYDTLKLADVERVEQLPDVDLLGMLAGFKAVYEDEMGVGFPQDPGAQLQGALTALAAGWNRTSTKMLRLAKGAPEDAGLSLIVQRMAVGLRADGGSGFVQFVNEMTGRPVVTGRFLPNSQGQDALMGLRTPHMISEIEREAAGQSAESLEVTAPDAFKDLEALGAKAAEALTDAVQVEFTIEDGKVWLLDASPARRSARASVRIAVDMANSGAISRDEALLRIEPRSLVEHLHPQIDPHSKREVFGTGLPASPGAATGKIVFSSEAAMSAEAAEAPCILVRVETSPEDIRGMHAAAGVLTVRGGMTSHAAVIARGLGLPCVVGAGDLRLNAKARTLTAHNGQEFREGDIITVDGTRGQAIVGAPPMIQPELGGSFNTLMDWADAARTIGVRANADTPMDARMARKFNVDGIGLCRTEHMFFDEERITVMREMILANSQSERREALDRLLPMQRSDFVELFEIMHGLPVTIRLLDPPLHEFLPHSRDEMQDLAEAMDIPVSQVIARAEELAEFNPMLGMRGVRMGVTMPEIYEMQARAIFEAAIEVNRNAEQPVVPEIMIPLVSANREVELIKERVDKIAADVAAEYGARPEFRLGAMVETPRAALRAGDLATSSAFLSFGTNDLTQMSYGLSRDDAGRFMRDYVNQGVYPEDPFHTLDTQGVGELMLLAAERGRASNPNLILGICGEHGGDPASVEFCKQAGFDYVSCSPFRVHIARLAAAQASIRMP